MPTPPFLQVELCLQQIDMLTPGPRAPQNNETIHSIHFSCFIHPPPTSSSPIKLIQSPVPGSPPPPRPQFPHQRLCNSRGHFSAPVWPAGWRAWTQGRGGGELAGPFTAAGLGHCLCSPRWPPARSRPSVSCSFVKLASGRTRSLHL